MSKRPLLIIALSSLVSISFAQQFTGFSSRYFGGVVQMPTNPSFVVKDYNGFELNLASASLMAGTNAYIFNKEWISDGYSKARIYPMT